MAAEDWVVGIGADLAVAAILAVPGPVETRAGLAVVGTRADLAVVETRVDLAVVETRADLAVVEALEVEIAELWVLVVATLLIQSLPPLVSRK